MTLAGMTKFQATHTRECKLGRNNLWLTDAFLPHCVLTTQQKRWEKEKKKQN